MTEEPKHIVRRKKLIDIERVRDLVNNGYYLSDIAKILDCSVGSLSRICSQKNIKYSKKPRDPVNFIDITGMKFGHLTVISRSFEKDKKKNVYWLCKCDCGNTTVSKGADLRRNKIKTCGCRMSIKSRRNWQGGEFVPKTYWKIVNENAEKRGIELLVSLDQLDDLFIHQNKKCALSDIDISFSDNTASLDRIDSSLGYAIGNIQWVHKHINMMKWTLDNDEFIRLCVKVADKSQHI